MEKEIKKRKRKFLSPGFSIYIMGIKCIVFFKYFEYKKTTKCHLLIKNNLLENDEYFEFIGTAKLSPEDKYDKKVGERIAFEKAIVKIIKLVNRTIDSHLNFLEEFVKELDEKLYYRLDKKQNMEEGRAEYENNK